jgi:cbb3-type cytochrome oxidase subunit 3
MSRGINYLEASVSSIGAAADAVSEAGSSLGAALTEPGMRYMMDGTLKQLQRKKRGVLSLYYNAGLFLFAIVFFGGLFYVIYRDKKSGEQERRAVRFSEEVLKAASDVRDEQRHATKELITDLPMYTQL